MWILFFRFFVKFFVNMVICIKGIEVFVIVIIVIDFVFFNVVNIVNFFGENVLDKVVIIKFFNFILWESY